MSRVIRLRRPPAIQQVGGVFVPESGQLDEVDRRWRRMCAANSSYFDGRLWHVIGVHRNGCGGAVVHVMDCAYRFYAVQDARFGKEAPAISTFAAPDGAVVDTTHVGS